MAAVHDSESADAQDVVAPSTSPYTASGRWSSEDLALLERTGEVRIAAAGTGRDASLPSRSTPIWIVVHDGEAYIRAYTGVRSRWFQAVAPGRVAVLTAGSRIFDVRLEPADPVVADGIDEGYRAKYGDTSYVGAMTAPVARAAALRVRPIGTQHPR